MHSFEDELKELESKISQMASAVGGQLTRALESLRDHNEELAKQSISADRDINLMEYDIENRVVRILALRQPVANDLRSTIIAIKIASDLERMGDLAKGIAKKTLATASLFTQDATLIQGLGNMGQFACAQLENVLQAYQRHDHVLAYQVWQKDAQLDAMNDALFHALIEHMTKDPTTVAIDTHFLFVVKSIERFGDHICNIAELVNYQVTGFWPLDEWAAYVPQESAT